MVDFEWYRSFVAIYQTGTVSAAAQVRSMTQPGISQHLAALERALDAPLFQRTPRQMMPTEAGQRLYTQVIASVEQLERLSTPSALRHEAAPVELRMGVPREFFYARGWGQLSAEEMIHYRLHLSFGQTSGLVKLLEDGKLDVVIATQRINHRALHYQPLQVEQFALVAPADLLLPAGLSTDEVARWLEGQRWLAYAADLPIIRRYWQEVFNRRPTITPVLIAPDLLMILRAVSHGLGVSVLPAYLCEEALSQGAVQILWQPENPPANQLYLTCRRERLAAVEIQAFFRWMAGTMP
ncbi:MAG: LysR family transcriptional regulator [Anaerolineae bacterium]|jgi:DNA-binding transcriptional LysR family regulator|nr:LysR family transcriptional regulator [Anaerolineae bacterium]